MTDSVRGVREPAPSLTVRPAVVEHNARRIVECFDGETVGVTKGVRGDPRLAWAMLDGGANALADSRLANLRRLPDGLDCDRYLIRIPMRSEVGAVVRETDVSIQSERSILRATADAASRRGEIHRVLLAVDVGDRREGIMPADLGSTLAAVDGYDSLEIEGVAAHVGSLNGVVPTAESVRRFVEHVEAAEAALGRRFPVVSAGSSNALPLCFVDDLPERVNQLRVGEGILLGTDAVTGETLPGFDTDAFVLSAEVVESKSKPSVPEGLTRDDASSQQPGATDRRIRDRAIVALGWIDVDVEGLTPLRDGVRVLGASSDHTVLDVTETKRPVRPGERLEFSPGYGALARSAASRYVTIAYDERPP